LIIDAGTGLRDSLYINITIFQWGVTLKNDVEYRVCFPEQRIFISEDHNWAFSAWEIGKQRGYIDFGAALVHIDAHVDYVDPEIEIIEEITTEKDAIDFGRNLGIPEFIIPAQQTRTIGSVYMISNDSVFINEETGFNRAYSFFMVFNFIT